MMKYLLSLLLLVAGVANAGLLSYDQIDSYGAESALWGPPYFNVGPVATFRGVNDGMDGFVVVGESYVADSALTYNIYVDVENLDLNDTFDYSLIAYTDVTPVTSSVLTLAPGGAGALELSGVTYDGLFEYGVKIKGGDDVFVTRLSNLRIVPEPATIATLVLGSAVILYRRK